MNKLSGCCSKLLLPVVRDRLYLAEAGTDLTCLENIRVLTSTCSLKYISYCDDFGPMNLSTIIEFVQTLQDELARFPTQKIVYCAPNGRRDITNAAFLLGGFMILVMKTSPEETWNHFCGLYDFEDFRDATFSPPDFGLTLLDCWRGLAYGMSLGWIGMSPEESMYDMEEYAHYDHPLNGEIHVVVPGKFVAFRSPRDIAGDAFYQDVDGMRLFSPSYLCEVFGDLGVSTVIRLNEPSSYDKSAFEAAGIEHYDLEFDDCTAPPNDIVARFMRIVDRSPGMIAVHCKAGLGRTGTLIALYLMLANGFGARDAIGWLRIVRPGCVIGEQQHYLCQVEKRLKLAGKVTPVPTPERQGMPCGVEAPRLAGKSRPTMDPSSRSAEQATQIAQALSRRDSLRTCGIVASSLCVRQF